ncbi:MAG: hypothetical protein ACYCTI_00445 [Acidimicrobiales bacterium]
MTRKVLEDNGRGRIVLIQETRDEREAREDDAFRRASQALSVTRAQARLLRRASR